MATYMSISVFFILCLFSYVNCWIPRIINGRPKGGMLGAPKVSHDINVPSAQWFNQRLDHFDGANYQRWNQRYFVNATFYKPGGPIFLMIGGEGPANPVWMVEGTWIQYAQMFGAICVMLEHRYYGDSHPVKDLAFENLHPQHRQALLMLANFIDWFLNTFGGSYPGSLSAWFRSKYPYMVDGAVATSAPIYAQLDFREYLDVVTDALDTTGTHCNQEILNATQTMYTWWGQPDKRTELEDMFKLCDKIDPDNILDKAGFFSNLAGNFEGVVQYNKDNRAFEGAIGTDITIDTLCEIMTDFTRGSAIQRYAYVNTLLLKTYSQSCLDFKYTKMIEDMRKTDWNSSGRSSGIYVSGRQWMYQTCAEFGWFQSSDCKKQAFSHQFPVNFSCIQCMDIYEKNMDCIFIDENIKDTNQYYGGRNISVTKVVFPNGSIDPWHAMGVTEDISPDATAIYIDGTAHCANMYPATDKDSPQLTAARKQIADLIHKWIQ
ncbi:putative serine protease F56F10.1 [Mercenaria mercenaria]|uniref:putative serine protease F56F10.1 n=1 Tax=Mercenaria mercenaria TaxID=6596 RepID=UPI00234EDCEC|nr:putative serine protease F56F10.1 [Mercenaria mercenaria]